MLIPVMAHLAVEGPEGRPIVDPGRDLGAAYNRIFDSCAQPGDWICLLDHDAMWTTRGWYLQILEAIRDNPRAGLITAVTNRIGRKYQALPDAPKSHDMREHFAFGAARAAQYGSQARDVTRESPISGVVMCMSHDTWERMGGFREKGFFGVDNGAHRDVQKIGRQVLLLPGLYVYHWYRGDGVGHGKMPKVHQGPR